MIFFNNNNDKKKHTYLTALMADIIHVKTKSAPKMAPNTIPVTFTSLAMSVAIPCRFISTSESTETKTTF